MDQTGAPLKEAWLLNTDKKPWKQTGPEWAIQSWLQTVRFLGFRTQQGNSHIRMEAKRTAMETVANSSKMAGYDTNHDTNGQPVNARPV
jgi:hypothetical protein